jgi:hypothetical protein
MLSAIKNALARVVGGSQPDRIEWCMLEIENDAARLCSLDTTVCLMPQIVDGNRLTFQMSPILQNTSSPDAGFNLLGHLRNTLDLDKGERIVIMSIVRKHVSNELDGTFKFDLSNVFDHDQEIERVRNKIDAVVAMDNRSVDLSIRKPPPKGNDNNIGTDNEALGLPVAGEEKVLDMLMESEPPAIEGDNADEIMRKADAMTVRGQRIHRNRAEITNTIGLGLIPPCTTSCDTKLLYKASVTHDIVRWFAGQDKQVFEDPNKFHSRINTNANTRVERPVTQYLIYPSDHALVLFIKMFEDDLTGDVEERMRLMTGDRADGTRWYQVDRDLVEEARDMILVVVYAQLYRTTLRDCTLVRIIEEDQEWVLVQKLAKQWGLKVDPATKRVSDWAVGSYRPVVVVTLHISYYLVTGVDTSAASLHKKKTILSPSLG